VERAFSKIECFNMSPKDGPRSVGDVVAVVVWGVVMPTLHENSPWIPLSSATGIKASIAEKARHAEQGSGR